MISSNNSPSLFEASSAGINNHLRIADVLLLHEDEEDGGDLPLLFTMDGCSTRRHRVMEAALRGGIVSRWFGCFRRPNGHEREEEEDNQDEIAVHKVIDGRDSSSAFTQNDQSGGCRCQRQSTESSFSMGVGLSLLCLMAASKEELAKMTDLRAQMQSLLQDFKEERQLRNRNISSDEEIGRHSQIQGSFQNFTVSCVQCPESSTTTTMMTYDQSLKCDTPKDVECIDEIDQLQAEFEAELERLHLHLDKERVLQHPDQQSVEVTVKDTASSESYIVSSGEVIDPITESQEAFSNGVPPYELERRLHEVLEARQEEHIRELEAALECAKRKLREKELEISWWRDTAKLISHHAPAPPRRFSERP